MKRLGLLFSFMCLLVFSKAQLSPAITSFLQNTTETGSYYMSGNSTVIPNNILVNCQKVEYSNDFVYITTNGVPAYPTGPFLDRNPSQAESQNAIFRIPLNPVQNTGTPSATTAGNIGIFVNGVALFDYRDGVAWDPTTNSICGGPSGTQCPGGPRTTQAWNRDAVPAEMDGFDCSKGHPAMGNYHHHQNPSAFKLDLEVVSSICNLYDADGLYTIDSTQHAPLIGFAYDGFPIYGAYGYRNADGTGGIARIKSGYQLRDISTRTTAPDGTDVDDGPNVNNAYPLGYFREDYEFVSHAGEDYLDEHNGRFCVTPEYPNGTYAYFATVDEDWNSAYPYAVGPTFYGVYANRLVTSINEPTTVYIEDATGISEEEFKGLQISIFPNPSSDLIAVQLDGLASEDLQVELLDIRGKLVSSTVIAKGSTIAYFNVQTMYEGTYVVINISNNGHNMSRKIVINKE